MVSGGVARTLVEVNNRMRLKFTPIEDATLGFWLMAMDLRHIDHQRFHTWAVPCCFKPPVRKEGERVVTRFQLAPEFEEHLCGVDPWLILHKVDSPTKMRYIGARVANWYGGRSVTHHHKASQTLYSTDEDVGVVGPQPKSYTETNGGASQVTLNELSDESSAARFAHTTQQSELATVTS